MKILFAVWELDPFFKLGGLGDVARSLPGVLYQKGIDVRIVIPFYKALKVEELELKEVFRGSVVYAGIEEEYTIYSVPHPDTGVPVYLLKNATYIDALKGADIFAFFDKAVVETVKKNSLGWMPDIIHCNDHHTSYIPLLIKNDELDVRTIFTIHNLAYQGVASLDIITKLSINPEKFRILQWEIKSRQLNPMLEGIVHADIVTTVSPTYAKEIITEAFGMGLDEVLRGREGKIFGILNGIDLFHKNKLKKESVHFPYECISEVSHDMSQWEACRKKNKEALQRELGLSVLPDVPMFAYIGRIDQVQKGMDILHRLLRSIDPESVQFVLLGTGNHEWEERFQWFSAFYPKNFSCNFFFDSKLAMKIYASSDFILIPSKYEPCGLIQMLAMYFGTIPVAHATGGLRDSIIDGKNGLLFREYTSESMGAAFRKAVDIWKNDRGTYNAMADCALKTDFSWEKSATKYLELYDKLMKGEF